MCHRRGSFFWTQLLPKLGDETRETQELAQRTVSSMGYVEPRGRHNFVVQSQESSHLIHGTTRVALGNKYDCRGAN